MDTPKEFWLITPTGDNEGDDWTIRSSDHEANVAARGRAATETSEMVIWHCTPVALYRPREPERVDLTEPGPEQPAELYTDGEWQDCRDDFYMPRHLYGSQMVELHFDGDDKPSGVRVEARSANWREAIRYRTVRREYDAPAPLAPEPVADRIYRVVES